MAIDHDTFSLGAFNAARPFASFLPGIAGPYGKPMWVFYCNRGQCIAGFGIRDRNGAMLEFRPADQAYALTERFGFRSFLRIAAPEGVVAHEPFRRGVEGVEQRLLIRPEEIVIEEHHPRLGLRFEVTCFTLAHEALPALVRRVRVENTGHRPVRAEVLDGLPRVQPYGLDEGLAKTMSRTMEAFAEVRHVEQALPFFKLKVVPTDRPQVERIDAGFFAFTLRDGHPVDIVVDPAQVFGSDTGLDRPEAFLANPTIGATAGRRETLSACAFAQLALELAPGQSAEWVAYFGQAADWREALALRDRIAAEAGYAARKRDENSALVRGIAGRLDVVAAPAVLGPYTRQSFLDNCLRGGQPEMVEGPLGTRVFHAYTRKHGDMERDYNLFQVQPTYWSQGVGNFRDVCQNRRNEVFTWPAIDDANLVSFFSLIQLDGYNPLVVEPERFRLAPERLPALVSAWPGFAGPDWSALLTRPFAPGELAAELIALNPRQDEADRLFRVVLGHAEPCPDARHGEGFWVDHWMYCLDLYDSYAALFPDRLDALLWQRRAFTYFDNEHVVRPRDAKTWQRADGSVRQLDAVGVDSDKARRIAGRRESPRVVRVDHGQGAIHRTPLLAKLLHVIAVKATLLDPFGCGLEMEADKPGWCDALNGLPSLFASSTHEAFALRRWIARAREALDIAGPTPRSLALPVEIARLLRDVAASLAEADATDFQPAWQRLTRLREAFREATRLGLDGAETELGPDELRACLTAIDATLARGLAGAMDADGLPVSYFQHVPEAVEALAETMPTPVRVTRFRRQPVARFLEGAVHALRDAGGTAAARAIHRAVRHSPLYDEALGMYRVNAPLDNESDDIGRSRVFAPGWLENESIFLHMHYKYLLEVLRAGLAEAFFADFADGIVALRDADQYGRSPLENSSFLASSRFADPGAHGVGFVARLSGASAEWISMLLFMALGEKPFLVRDGALRFAPRPTLAAALFNGEGETARFSIKLFGATWMTYLNPSRRPTYGEDGVMPTAFEMDYADGRRGDHRGAWLPTEQALDLRAGRLKELRIHLA